MTNLIERLLDPLVRVGAQGCKPPRPRLRWRSRGFPFGLFEGMDERRTSVSTSISSSRAPLLRHIAPTGPSSWLGMKVHLYLLFRPRSLAKERLASGLGHRPRLAIVL